MGKTKTINPFNISSTSRYSPHQMVLSAFAFVVLIAAIVAVLHISNGTVPSNNTSAAATVTNAPASTSSNSKAVLPPATVPSKVAECSQVITYNSNGTSGPLQCANGDLNVTEWNALSALEPKVMTLGYSPTETQVEAAICSDASDSASDESTADSNLIESLTYQISALYYGWSFSSNPTTVLSNSSC